MVERQICVCERLRFDSLRRVDYEHRALAGGKGTRDFVVEVDMTGSVYKIQLIDLAVARGIVHFDRVRLYSYSALALKIHVIKYLSSHIALRHGVGELKESVREGRFAMVDMRYDAEISDVFFLGRQFIDPFVGLLVKLGHKGLCGGFADPHIAEALTRYLLAAFHLLGGQ